MAIYYDGTKLLSLKDINGNTPEIFICTSNRTAGKTTYFNRLAINRFKKNGGKFMLVFRFNYELDDCANKFFKEINKLFFPNDNLTSEKKALGIYHELFLNDISCGYAVALNNADSLKKNSHFFSDTELMLFDEFQSETNHYCANEVSKFISLHTSVARGKGEQSRYVPVIMISNPVTLLNPYYVDMGISDRLKSDTKFLRGNGFVLEQNENESAENAISQSAFMQAFSNNKYVAYSAQGVYLNDNLAFIENVVGKQRYIATLIYNNCAYAVREFSEQGILYCDDRADLSFRTKISVTTSDHNINYVMLKKNDFLLQQLRYYFDKGCFRFKNLKCKECIFKTISY